MVARRVTDLVCWSEDCSVPTKGPHWADPKVLRMAAAMVRYLASGSEYWWAPTTEWYWVYRTESPRARQMVRHLGSCWE